MAVSAVTRSDLARLERSEKATEIAFVLPCMVFLAVFFFYPVSSFLVRGFFGPDFTFAFYAKALQSPIYLSILWRTLEVAFLTTICCLLLGYPVAYVMAHCSGRTKAIVLVLVLVPLWTNILVRMFGWLALLGRAGVFNTNLMAAGLIDEPIPMLYNRFAVVLGMTHIMLPYMILPCYSIMTNIPGNLLDAAANLGAPPRRAFWRVYFPLSLPGVGAGCLLVFIISSGFFITPEILGGARDVILPQIIEEQINEALNWSFGAALSGLLMIVTVTLYVLYERLMSVERIHGDKAQ